MGYKKLISLFILILSFLPFSQSRVTHGKGNAEGAPAEAQTKNEEEGCFQRLTVKGGGGSITSPNFPDKYPPGIDCRWLLTAERPGTSVMLRIETLRAEPDTHCKLDYLQVYLGSSTLAPSLGPFCGTVNDRLLKTNSSKVLVVFHSDMSHEDKGFRMDYFTQSDSDCQSLLTDESGTLRSPGFPGNYPDGADCWTLVSVREGQKVVLSFDSVDLEYGDNCTFDYVQIFDGQSRNSSLLGQICRQSDATSFESSSNSLLVHFHSDDSVNQKGYRARYTAVDKRSAPHGDCPWEASEWNGTIASPNYPSNYPGLSNCSIWILAPEGNRIFVTLDALQLEMDEGCPFDFLLLEEHSAKSGTKALGRFCGNSDEPTNVTSAGNELHVVFQSDHFSEFSGFKLRYFFLGSKTGHKEKMEVGKPQFSLVPQNATLEEGASHMLHCNTVQREATIRWQKGDTLLSGGNPLSGVQLLANNTLWIRSMEQALSGIYSCIASLPEGDTVTVKAYVLAKNKDDLTCGAVFRKVPRDASFSEGEFLQLECLAGGAEVSWRKNGAPLPPDPRVTVLRIGHLFVDRARLGDAGVYTCVARDPDSGCERRASAVVQVHPRIKIEEICGRPKVEQMSWELPQEEHGKIIGGHDAKKGAYPWQAMLWEPSLKSFCGGTLLNERWIATAAHCFVNYKNLRWDRVVVKLGKHDREREEEGAEFRTGIAERDAVVVHPAYDRNNFDNDLALVRLRERVTFSDHVMPACLGDARLLDTGRMGTVVGWGKLKDNGPSPRFLQEVRLPVVEQAACVRSTNYTVTRNMFCAGYTQEILGDACHGDSGGPFLMTQKGRWYLAGVVSWGEGCGAENKYGFYTRLPNYASWIKAIVKS